MSKDFDRWLTDIGLGNFAETFAENDIDFDVITEIEDADLKELGLSLGNRKRFLRAAAALAEAGNKDNARVRAAEPIDPSITDDSDARTTEQTERRQVAVMFADLTGYTRLSAELDPEELQDFMAEFFRTADEAVLSFGGTVDKHLGDGVMAVFGAPVSHGDDTLRAVRAATVIHERLKEISCRLGRSLTAHIGIASGEVLAGAGTNEYTVIGDAVNLASRLSDLAKANETFLSNDVHSEVFHEMLCEENANVSIKGLQDAVSVWKVLGSRDKPIERNLLPFVGRVAEREQFRSTIKAIEQSGSGAAFIFRGEPGIGKTRLATECMSIAADHRFATHHVLVLDFGSGLGSDPLRAIFKGLLQAANINEPDALRKLAEQLMAEDAFDSDDEAFVCDLLGLPMSSELQAYFRAIENTTRNRRKVELVGRMLQQRSRQQPQIILIEDLHWADQVTLDLSASLVAKTADCSAVLLMTSRIEGDPFDNVWRSGTGSAPIYTIDVRPLTSRETQQLAKQAGAQNAEALSAEIGKAGGNPLFLELMIRSNADSQTDALPGNLRSLVQARIDRLEPIDRRAIQAAAVVGQRFALDLVRHLLGVPEYQPAGLLERSLIQPMGEQFLFAHALVQEGVYASVTRRNAQAIHLQAAEWFEERDSILYAEHLARAEDERAPRAYLEAAQSLMDGLRFETGKQILVKGVSCAKFADDLFQLNICLGQASIQTADLDQATSAFEAAIRHAETDQQACEAHLGLALSYRDRPDVPIEQVQTVLSNTDKLAADLDSPKLKIESLYYRSYMHNLAAEPQECLEAARAAFDLVTPDTDPMLRVSAFECLSMANYINGRIRSSISISKEMLAISVAEKIKDKQLVAGYQIGICHYYLAEYGKSIRAVADALAEAERYGVIRAAVIANEVASRSNFALGRFEQARSFAEKSLSFAETAGMQARVALAFIRLSEIALSLNDPSATHLAQRAVEKANTTYVRPWAFAMRARTETDPERAKQLFAESEAMLNSKGCAAHDHFHVRVLQMEDALDRKDWAALDLAADKLEQFTKPEPLAWTDFHIGRGRAIANWGRGQKDEDYQRRLADLREIRNQAGMKIWLPEDS